MSVLFESAPLSLAFSLFLSLPCTRAPIILKFFSVSSKTSWLQDASLHIDTTLFEMHHCQLTRKLSCAQHTKCDIHYKWTIDCKLYFTLMIYWLISNFYSFQCFHFSSSTSISPHFSSISKPVYLCTNWSKGSLIDIMRSNIKKK